LCENVDKKEDQDVSICKNWIEVTSKHCSNSNNLRKPDSLPANQTITTSNHYAPLINLQDSVGSVTNMIVSNEQGLLHVSQRVDRQMKVINKEENSTHDIPTILNGKTYSKVTNETSLSTVNIQMQSSIKRSSKVIILGDSHLKGCTERLNNHLGDMFRITGWIKPSALAEEILDKPIMDLVNLNK
jgi:hypothetical protein